MGGPGIKVLIVEDSNTVRDVLEYILESDPQIEVCGKAANGKEALSLIEKVRPDVITMDMRMPVMDGEEATRIIMETDPIPILIITASLSTDDVKFSYRALNAGALKVINKPAGLTDKNYKEIASQIIRDVKLISKIKLVKRIPKAVPAEDIAPAKLIEDELQSKTFKYVVIGASTGGPPVIMKILKQLPPGFKVSIIIVQHIAKGFLEGFVAWLKSSTGHDIKITEEGQLSQPGVVYLAAEGFNTGLLRNGRFEVRSCNPGALLCPTIAYLFNSMANNFGTRSVGVLLTGMGKDGADELKEMREAGAITIAQNKDSSVIFGMPGEAVKIDAAKYVLSPDEIANTLKLLIY